MAAAFPRDIVLTPLRRWPTTLPEATVDAVAGAPVEERVPRREGCDRPAASIVVVTYNGLVFSRLCFESLLAPEPHVGFELVVVDNASSDGTSEYLAALAQRDGRVRVVFNERNIGFAAATNRGVAVARGTAIVFLNNDTIPAGNWLMRLMDCLGDGGIGLVGATTNRAGNEAEIETSYRTYGELEQFAAAHERAQAGAVFDIRTATMFCAAMRRGVWDTVGPLDERFQIGLFEDDDLSMRVRAAGLRVVCAESVFVHHFGQASIGQLGPTGEYGSLFHANRARWEEKWGQPWVPYEKRVKPAYGALVQRVRQFVCATTPPGATVLVISKGDNELLQLDGRRAEHFPQGAGGSYAGHNPSDSEACIAELERLRSRGAGFLVIPETSQWWLQHYAAFAQHLGSRYRAVGDGSPATVIILDDGLA